MLQRGRIERQGGRDIRFLDHERESTLREQWFYGGEARSYLVKNSIGIEGGGTHRKQKKRKGTFLTVVKVWESSSGRGVGAFSGKKDVGGQVILEEVSCWKSVAKTSI